MALVWDGEDRAAPQLFVMVGRIMRRVIITIVFIIILPFTALSEKLLSEKDFNMLKSINIEDGIDSKEAEILSKLYFLNYISGCGVAESPVDGGEYWLSIPHVGYAGVPLEDKIKINKKTGTIELKGYPTVVNPINEWKLKP